MTLTSNHQKKLNISRYMEGMISKVNQSNPLVVTKLQFGNCLRTLKNIHLSTFIRFSRKKRHKYVSVCVFQRVLHSSPVKHSPFLVTLIKYFVRLLQSVFIIRGKSSTTQQFNNFVRLQDLTIDPATGTPAVQHRLL